MTDAQRQAVAIYRRKHGFIAMGATDEDIVALFGSSLGFQSTVLQCAWAIFVDVLKKEVASRWNRSA